MPMRLSFTRSAIVLAITLSASACQTWKVENRPVETVMRDQRGPVAVTMKDLRWVVLKNPSVANDSIVGTRVAGNTYGKGRTSLSIHGVRAVERRRFSFVRTVGLGIAAAFVPTLYRLAVVEDD